MVGLEVLAPGGNGSRRILTKYLSVESNWTSYQNRLNVFIAFDRLKPEHKRTVLLRLFPQDVIDEDGWWHVAVLEVETLWSLSEWIAGRGSDFKKIMSDPRNSGRATTLRRGERLLIPASLLNSAMRKHTPKPLVEPVAELETLHDELAYSQDSAGTFATYRLKRGETLYSHVVARFTDFHEGAEILKACDTIAARSGIRDVTDIDAGAKIKIPADMLSPRYQPRGQADREAYEATLVEAQRLKGSQGQSRYLEDVVVILDPGHGGKDYGAPPAKGLYEDELNYDIVNRIKRRLERETGARVYVTVRDRSSGDAVNDGTRFQNDSDEELLTSPPHRNLDGNSLSINLRWMLINSIYDREVRNGTDPDKIIFTSIHTDSLYKRLRGMMVYVPGAQRRRPQEARSGNVYLQYAEGRGFSRFSSTASERSRDESLSRNFAEIVISEFGKHRIKRHDKGDPIRNQIVRRGRPFLPGVLRNNDVPTKVLIETANINNSTDRKRLADPEWRELFAKAYVSALRTYFKADPPARLAQTD